MAKFYVTHYTTYPIYEPAEGGYYYEGISMAETYGFNSLKRAKEYLHRLGRSLGFTVHPSRRSAHSPYETNRYIGDREYLRLEFTPGSEESGWHPYE